MNDDNDERPRNGPPAYEGPHYRARIVQKKCRNPLAGIVGTDPDCPLAMAVAALTHDIPAEVRKRRAELDAELDILIALENAKLL